MGSNVEETAAHAHRLLDASGADVATAESLTGGRLAALLTTTPGASRTYVGGVVAYATAAKVDLLGVSADLVASRGVVSAACAEAMADGIRERTGATYALSTTGVAGPDPQEGRPVGTVFVGLSGPSETRSAVFTLVGGRSEIQDGACAEALDMLVAHLRVEETGVG